jgi:hypothetical protein
MMDSLRFDVKIPWNVMRALAWISVTAWVALLAAADWILATCEFDCQDSGAIQGLLLLAVLAPAVAVGARNLVRTGLSTWKRRALLALGGAAAALIAWLVAIFIGI